MGKEKHKDRYEKKKHHYYSKHRSPKHHFHSHSSRSSDKISTKEQEKNVFFHERENQTQKEYDDLSLPMTSFPSTSKHDKSTSNVNPNFPWFEYRNTLNKMFFRDKDIIKRKTQEYDDFWAFLKKYQDMQQKTCVKRTPCWEDIDYDITRKQHKGNENSLELPNSYNKRYKINFSIITGDMKELLVRGHLFKDDNESELTQERITEFRYILHLYVDFLQKQKFAKVKKLRQDQANLPISNFRNQIVNTVQRHQVVLVAGDTGCGKSTQVPQYLLASGFDSIACTQPRRIACISLSKRVAYETLNDYESEVGYQIRFEKSKTSHTKILFLTEGLLLRQVSSDPMLTNYKVVILDEVHERHLPCDFLLGIMKCLTIQRPDLKIVLMSATINIQLFSEYFNDCPVIQVPGRLFPIQIHYFPIPTEEQKTQSGKISPAPYVRVLNMIDNKYPASERGDLLIFLSGLAEISIVEEAAKQYAERTKSWIILPLHSTLSIEEQDKVFDIAPESVRKCIISTNIAETSVTIDGVRFVTDSGKVKEMSYDPNCHMQRLQEFWISRASAEQRKGRAGRTGPGVCFRLYSEQEYDALSAYPKPEIQRVSLDSLLLQMISLGLPDGRKFPFLEPPSMTSIEESLQNLKEQGALTNEETLTPMGQMLSRLPVEVTIGKMLIHGCMFSLMDPMLSLAAAMSVSSPFTNRSTRDPEIMNARRQLESDHGDPFTLLNAYHRWLENKSDHHYNSRKWCRRHGLEEQRFYAMSKLRKQFKELLMDAGLLSQEQEFYSSHDRSMRFGELKQLKDMKREFHRAPKRRKILRLESCIEGFAEDQSDAEGDGIDIKDVEFRMSFDKRQVYNLSSASQVTSFRDLICLKILICSGLYPRLAIADVHNSYKADSEQLFHTKGKPFTFLHPNGVLALQPDLLQLREEDIVEKKSISSHTPLSTKHQLVAYMSLLETTKPYLMNCLRVPSCHVLLLVSRSIDTNQDFTRLVCDGWLELRFADAEVAQEFVSKAWYIRDLWLKLIQEVFQALSHRDKEEKANEVQRMGKKLQNSIIKYLYIEVVYSVKRLLAADIKNMYVGPNEGCVPVPVAFLSEAESITENPIKGGLQIKDYLTYNCLTDPDEKYLQYIQKPWTCSVCGLDMVATVLDQVRHKEKCQVDDDNTKFKGIKDEQTLNPLKKSYFCPECQEELFLTPTETLHHRRTHLKQ